MRTVDQVETAASTHVRSLTPAQLEAHLLAQDVVVVDVREPDELARTGTIPGAVHIPRGVLEFGADLASPSRHDALQMSRHDALQMSRRTVLYCSDGTRSALAAEALQTLGYAEVAHLEGGLHGWVAAGLPVWGLESWHLHQAASGTTDDERGAHR